MPDMPLPDVVVVDEDDGIDVVDDVPGVEDDAVDEPLGVVFMLPVVDDVLPGLDGGVALVVVLGVVVFGELVFVALPRVPAPAPLALAPPPWSPLLALPVDCAYERPMAPTTNTVAMAEASDLRVFIAVTPEKSWYWVSSGDDIAQLRSRMGSGNAPGNGRREPTPGRRNANVVNELEKARGGKSCAAVLGVGDSAGL